VGDSKTKTANTSSASSTPSCTSLKKKCTAFLDEIMEYFEQMEEFKPNQLSTTGGLNVESLCHRNVISVSK
jgi:Asp-tRNA(Asn)/Glu-tRNA(Gln) amidotransferase C subunit